MARSKNENVLTESFLLELYNAAITDNYICGIVATHMRDEYLPDQQFQQLNALLKQYYQNYKSAPQYGIVTQMSSKSRAVSELLDEINESSSNTDTDALRDQFESYLKLIRFKKAYKDIGKMYEDGQGMAAIAAMEREAKDLSKFSLKPDEFVDVAATFDERLRSNKEAYNDTNKKKVVNSFYIDGLDEMNQGRNLRKQLSVFLAMSGVGKSHLARWIGSNAAYFSGLNVLHVQLEGAESETLDAYQASLIHTQAFNFEKGNINQHTIDSFHKELEKYAGTLKVKAYPRFGKEVSTIDVKNDCEKYKEKFGFYPDILIIDSLDLLNDSSGKSWDNKSLRFKRIAVANDLKDMAAELDCWIAATYQATIEDQQKVDDENFVLNGYNLSEAKGLQRPCTHLISLNQSRKEYKENTMRLFVAKSRFFKKSEPFKIVTDFEHEQFYSREATMALYQQQRDA